MLILLDDFQANSSHMVLWFTTPQLVKIDRVWEISCQTSQHSFYSLFCPISTLETVGKVQCYDDHRSVFWSLLVGSPNTNQTFFLGVQLVLGGGGVLFIIFSVFVHITSGIILGITRLWMRHEKFLDWLSMQCIMTSNMTMMRLVISWIRHIMQVFLLDELLKKIWGLARVVTWPILGKRVHCELLVLLK